jgi:hypothetical protein
MQGAAAKLATDFADLILVHGERADCRFMNMGEETLHHAAAKDLGGNGR